MRPKARERTFRSLLVLACAGFAVPARADEQRDSCLAAYVDGQNQQNAGALMRARQSLEKCADDACPGMIKRDCARWLEDVTHAIPSVVLSVRDEHGTDLVDSKASIDGEPVAIDGKPVNLDPGRHAFHAERAGLSSRTEEVVLVAGEHDRVVALTLSAPPTPTPPTPMMVTPPAPAVEPRTSPLPWALGGVGVAALGVFSFFAIRGASGRADLGCDRGCPPDDYSRVSRDFVVADVMLGVGVAALGAAVVTWFLTREPSRSIALR